jgi:hypothetical protein
MDRPIFCRQVRFDQLGRCYERVGTALIEAGVQVGQVAELLAKCVSLRCCQCGLVVSGAELGEAVVAGARAEPVSAKVVRLGEGYCARRDCRSYYCELLFQDSPLGIDWASVWQQAGVDEDRSPAPGAPTTTSGRCSWRLAEACCGRRQLVWAALAAAVLVALYFSLRTPSWSSNPSPYRADPATSFRALPASDGAR